MSDDTNTELCGYIKDDGEPCKLPGSRGDKRCHHHTDVEGEQARGGRPTELDGETYAAIMDAAERGLTYEGIARTAGIGLSTLNDWRDQDDDFSRELEQQRSVGERRLVDRVAEDKPEFILERSYDYVKTERHEVDADVDQTTTHNLSGVEADEVREFLRYRRESDD